MDVTLDSIRYPSLAEHPFFAELDRLHEKYGASFSLYLYYRENSFDVEQVTRRLKEDFIRRNEWLKLGFHAVQPGFDTLRDGSVDTLRIYLDRTNRAIASFADSSNVTKRSRLNRFYASSCQLSLLDSEGFTGLMGADDDRQSYSLSAALNEKLRKQGKIKYGNMEILRTDLRLEKLLLPEIALEEHAQQDTLTIFTHEREFGMLNRWKLDRLLELLRGNHPVFLN